MNHSHYRKKYVVNIICFKRIGTLGTCTNFNLFGRSKLRLMKDNFRYRRVIIGAFHYQILKL